MQQIRDALCGIINLDDDIQSIFNTEKTTGTTMKKQDQKPDENFPKQAKALPRITRTLT
jgi:hypothetical protein